jgi:hypothetical protein
MEKLLINLLRIGIPLILAWKFFKPDYHILDNLLKFLLLFSIWGLIWEFVLLIASKILGFKNFPYLFAWVFLLSATIAGIFLLNWKKPVLEKVVFVNPENVPKKIKVLNKEFIVKPLSYLEINLRQKGTVYFDHQQVYLKDRGTYLVNLGKEKLGLERITYQPLGGNKFHKPVKVEKLGCLSEGLRKIDSDPYVEVYVFSSPPEKRIVRKEKVYKVSLGCF